MKITAERLEDGTINIYENGKLRCNYPASWTTDDAILDYGIDREQENRYR